MPFRLALKQLEKDAQRGLGEKGLTCCYCGKEGHLKQDCSGSMSSLQRTTLERRLPYELQASGARLSCQSLLHLFGEGYPEQCPGLCFHEYGACSLSPRVWADGKALGRAQNAIHVIFSLKDPHLLPHQKQYPLKHEVKKGLKSTTENLQEQGLLIPCNSP